MKRDFDKKCAIDEELSAFVDGDMDEATASALAEHLSRCKVCNGAMEEIRGISAELSTLANAEPPAFLWSRIKQEHEGRNPQQIETIRKPWKNWWTIPALATAASIAAVVIMVAKFSAPTPAMESIEARNRGSNNSELNQIRALSSVEEAEQIYAEAITSLEQSLTDEKKTYSAEVQNTIDQSLADIDGAIARCKNAIKQDPKNMNARKKALLAYQQKVDLLTELVVERR